QAADVYVHAARAETFPNAILEALACGLPVVATAVGGIPEQVTEHTGVLVPAADAVAMASAIERILSDDTWRRCLGASASRDAAQRFDVRREAADYLRWYRAILQN